MVFGNYILVKHFLKKDSKIIVPKKKELHFFLELYFGETLLKKDSKIIGSRYFFGIIFW